MLVLAFILALAMMTLLFDDVLDDQRNPNQQVMTNRVDGIPEVTLKRNRYGHYFATGSINGHAAEFLLDTGATHVAIPGKLAQKWKLKRGPDISVSTANGVVTAYMTRLDRVDLGDISLTDVRATINPQMKDEEILLGMSFLKELEMIQRGDTLILKQY